MKKIINSINLKTIIQTLIVIGIVAVALLYKSTGRTVIAENPDSVVVLDSEHRYLTQSYQIPNRNICGVEIPVVLSQSTDISGRLICEISRNQDGSEVLCRNEVELEAERDSYLLTMPETKLEPGRRVYIRLTLEPENATAKLAIPVFSDYAGCQLAGQDYEGAICASLLYKYSGNIAGLMRIMIVIISITLLYMLIWNRDFGSCIAMSFASIVIYLLFWGIFGFLNAGIVSLMILASIIAISIPIIAALSHKSLLELCEPGMVVFIVLFFAYFVLDKDVITGKVDDLNHWSLAVRDMWFSDSLAYHIGNAYRSARYTPGFAIIEYLYIRLYGAYREGIAVYAANMTGFAFLGVMLSGINWKKWVHSIPTAILMAALPLMFFGQHYGVLYVDAYLGIIGAYLFVCYYTEEFSLFQVVRITLGSIMLILTKEMGIVIAFSFYIAVIINLIRKNHGVKRLFKNKDTISYFISGIISVLFFAIWQIYVNLSTIRLNKTAIYGKKIFTATQTIEHGIEVYSGNAVDGTITSEAKTNTVVTIIKTLFRWYMEPNMYYARMSFLVVMGILLSIFALVALGGLYKKININIYELFIVLFVGLLIYQIALLATYIFVFNEGDAISAQERYIASYMLLIAICLFGCTVVGINQDKMVQVKHPFVSMLLCAFVFVVTLPQGAHFYINRDNADIFYECWDNSRKLSDVTRTFMDKGEGIYYIGYEDNIANPQINYLSFHNAIIPSSDQNISRWKPVLDTASPYDCYIQVCTPEELQTLLMGYKYVYLRDFDSYFIENYGAVFGNSDELICGGFYTVEKTEDSTILLHRIAYKNIQ